MPGQYRYGVDRLVEALEGPVKDGLQAVLLFGVLDVSAIPQQAGINKTQRIQATFHAGCCWQRWLW